MKRLYKAINEGLKLSLIDFSNNKILKSSYVDSRTISKQDIDNWYKSGEDMSEDMYKELCNDKYIGFYIVDDNKELNNIFNRINFEHINLNWIDVSSINKFQFHDKDYDFNLDILYWDINKIPNSAFYNCESLTSINIPEGITSIGSGAFYGCTSLTFILIPDSVTSIGGFAFETCMSLKSILIPEGVTSIGENEFLNCKSLTSILIPNSITSIDDLSFYNCTLLTSIQYNGTIKQWNTILIENTAFCGLSCTVHCIDGDIKLKL